MEQPRWPNSPSSGAVDLTERGPVSFSGAMGGFKPPTFAECLPGERIHVVGHLKCWDHGHETHVFRALNDNTLFLVLGLIEGTNECFTFMNAKLQQQYPMPLIVVDGET